MDLSGGGLAVGEYVGGGGDDVDGEADKKCADGRVDGPEEGEDDGQEPYWYHHRQPRQCSEADALRVVHADHLLPHEIQRRARKSERDELRVQCRIYE